jgi:hypothetical protein
MATPRVTIRIQVERGMMERIQELSHHLDLLPSDFIEQAIVSELGRQESQRRAESATLDALQRNVLAQGQSVTIHADEESADTATCQLCLRVMPRGSRVDGPLLCDACYALAKGDRAH